MRLLFTMTKLKLINRCCCLCLSSLLVFYVPAVEAAHQTHDSIYKTAKSFAATHVSSNYDHAAKIDVGKLDSRLKLNKCNKPLQGFLSNGSSKLGKITIGVKCSGTKPWKLYVPVTISVFKDVLVTKKALHKGDLLTESDLKLEKHDLAKLPHGYFDIKQKAAGMKVKRRVKQGAVLTPAMLKRPRMISRGQKVSIMAMSGRMQVRVDGKALANGSVGDRIRVMNIKSKQKLEGVITASGEVKVDI